ncbi:MULTISPECIES: hypothetical protein [Streptomyces]|uniref:hypothetical protein n=1 Tax=Streptomyces TaxID=1883 RepID=UPI000B9E1596|nr:hypothetical protein [Streptomyces kasugaensis]
MSTSTQTTWPKGVIARYLTVGGGFVDVTERSGYYAVAYPTETYIKCHGCGTDHTVDWGWSAYHDEFGEGPQPDFDEGGTYAMPHARAWAQSHAETCRAMPRPDRA